MNSKKKHLYYRAVVRKRKGYEQKFLSPVRKVLNDHFRKVAERIDVTNYNSDVTSVISDKELTAVIEKLYITVGKEFASDALSRMKSLDPSIQVKQDDDAWEATMIYYVHNKVGDRIKSIAAHSREEAKRIIRLVIDEMTAEGAGAQAIASQIKKQLLSKGIEMNTWRALRIARTEVMTASNQAIIAAADSLNKPYEKYWIPTYDTRTRDTHLVMEAQNPKRNDEKFQVGNYFANAPGDPALPAEEVINCRCTIVTI